MNLFCVSRFPSAFILGVIIFVSCEELPGESEGDDEEPVIEEPYEVLEPENVVPAGDRTLGINISESRAGFDSAFLLVQQAGSQVVELNIPWDEIETGQGRYEDPGGLLEATRYYGAYEVQVALSIAVINTVKRTAPDYLDGYDYDAPEFIGAFKAMTDWLLRQVPENVTLPCISIGNEVDLFLEGDQWNAYTVFYQEVVSHLRSQYPDIRYGVKTTVMKGALGSKQTEIKTLNLYSDIIMLNYYPQDEEFRVMEPGVVHEHFIELISGFQGKKIWLTEVGYQSGSEFCGSSKTKQAHFYHELFKAWDTFHQQIPYIMIDWLHDQPPGQVALWESYYGSSDAAFVEYLSTLGLRNYDNTDKPAWIQLLAETSTRGW